MTQWVEQNILLASKAVVATTLKYLWMEFFLLKLLELGCLLIDTRLHMGIFWLHKLLQLSTHTTVQYYMLVFFFLLSAFHYVVVVVDMKGGQHQIRRKFFFLSSYGGFVRVLFNALSLWPEITT